MRIASFNSNWEIDLIPNTVDSNTKELKIGLRRIYNYQSRYKYFVITVKDPENNVKQLYGELQGDKWVYVTYLQDFKTAKPGTYTIIWEVNEWDNSDHVKFELNNFGLKASPFKSNIGVLPIKLPDFQSVGEIWKNAGDWRKLYTPEFLNCHQFEITNDKNE
ncbi:hypothetical protein [Dolichospermum circinale]|uniref:hypothetical protein n=1 Tax=Dolichospermum circinale TaxID=109265 RepID=UPI002330C63D|nr:hypothetical protein [Dolichospermum circinale]MDB9452551.1 hypothetical protein [Dolichospermum circinale CS-547]